MPSDLRLRNLEAHGLIWVLRRVARCTSSNTFARPTNRDHVHQLRATNWLVVSVLEADVPVLGEFSHRHCHTIMPHCWFQLLERIFAERHWFRVPPSVVVAGDQAKISDREYAHVSRAPYYGRFETGSAVVMLPAIIVTLICATIFSRIASFIH